MRAADAGAADATDAAACSAVRAAKLLHARASHAVVLRTWVLASGTFTSMESRLVLVIEDDEPTANRLAAAIREADYEVVVSSTATDGLDIAIEIKPDCVVCDMDLPDEDGFWVARSIRTHPSPVSVAPFVFLSAYDDAHSRLEGFNVGADVYLTKPFQVDEVVAQVSALVQMAARLRQRRDSILSVAPAASYGTAAIEGDMRQMSIATVLSVLGMERRTGIFEVVSKKRHAQIEISGGYVVNGVIGGTHVNALTAMRAMLSWSVGRFSFTPLPPYELPQSLRTVQALLLDAAKAEDEAAASLRSGNLPLGLSTFGGPPSRPDDTGPPSSRAMREATGPVSLAFDLIPSRKPEPLPAAEVAAAVDAPLSAYERVDGSAVTEDAAISVRVEDAAISVRADDLEFDIGGERMLLEEQTPNAAIPIEIMNRAAPTPPAGIPLQNMRNTPAIMPPPDSSAPIMKPLPTPPLPPRPVTPAAPRGRVPPRASPKKN